MGWISYLFLTSQLYGYPTPVDFNGNLMRWNRTVDDPNIYFKVETEDQNDQFDYLDLATESANLWNQVPGSFLKILPIDSDHPTADITIKIKSTFANMPDTAGFSEFDEFDGLNPSHCNIEVLDSSSILSLKKTILHELGHCLGLGHSLIPEAIMSYSLNKNSYALDVDDQAAIARLYPSDGSDPELPLGCGISPHSKSSNTAVMYLILLAPFCLATWRGTRESRT